MNFSKNKTELDSIKKLNFIFSNSVQRLDFEMREGQDAIQRASGGQNPDGLDGGLEEAARTR